MAQQAAAQHCWLRRVVGVGLALAALYGCSAAGPPAGPADDRPPPGVSASSPAPAADAALVGVGDPQRGAALFAGRGEGPLPPMCVTCHAAEPERGVLIGPNLSGVAERAPGDSPADYLRESIQVHDAAVAEGFQPGMVRAVLGDDYGALLSPQAIEDLVAYLLTLEAGDSPAAQATAAPPQATATATPSPRPAAGAAAPTRSATLAAPTPSTPPDLSATPRITPTARPSLTATPQPTPSASSSAASATIVPTPTAAADPPTAAPTDAPTPEPTAAPPAATPEPPSPTPPPAPTPEPPPTATVLPPTAPPTAPPAPTAEPPPNDPNLAVYTGCVTCHDQHPNQVQMPHPLNPQCLTCHSGSPNRVGCPTCHSTHRIETPHEVSPTLACNTCHQ